MELPKAYLKRYPGITGKKSGFLITGGKCFYLFGNRCCEAKCELLMINSDSMSVMSDTHESLLAYLSEESSDGVQGLRLYIGGKMALRVRELVLMYSVPLNGHEFCGIISGGMALPTQDVRFTDNRLTEVIRTLLQRREEVHFTADEQIKQLALSIERDEVKALSELHLAGMPLTEKDEE